jgi:hypothetical protein
MKSLLAVFLLLVFAGGAIAQVQSAPTVPPVQIGQWYTWKEFPMCGIPGIPGCPPNWQTVQVYGIWTTVFVGDPGVKTLSVTMLYTDSNGMPLVQTEEVVISRLGWQMFIFVVGKVQPTGFVATARVIGEVSETLTASDPNSRGTLYYAGASMANMATSAIQNAWTYPVGTGVLVSTTFQASDTASTGILAVLNYEDGNSEARIVPRQATTWLPTTKPVKRTDLYRLVVGNSVALVVPTTP